MEPEPQEPQHFALAEQEAEWVPVQELDLDPDPT
jgi:hypothetical protein